MNTRSITFRLVVWHAGWLAALFLVFGVFVYQSLEYYLLRSLREGLARRTRQVAELVQRTALRGPELEHVLQNNFAPEANNRFTRVTIAGQVIYVSGPPAEDRFNPLLVPAAEIREASPYFDRRTARDGRVMLIEVLQKESNGHLIVVEEGEAEAPIAETLHKWLLALTSGLLLLITGAVGGGILLVRRSLSPVVEIMRTAERISSRNLGERLPVPETRDEIEQLSIALNQMIRRLDESFQQTRRFLADASHELRTPLTTIQAGVQAIMDRHSDQPDIHHLAAGTLEDIERLKLIVEGLFALSRLDAGEGLNQSGPFDLFELAASTTEQMCLLATDKSIRMTCHPHAPVVVEGDRARIKQVVVNLLDNAIKYTPAGGRVDVRVSQRDSLAVLEVSDNGVGIPAEALPRVFERFFRVDKARSRELGGAGLGLSIVKSICAAHGGSVEVRSEVNQGTCMTVTLPLTARSSS